MKTDTFKSAPTPLFKFVQKTVSNIGSKLSVLKSLAVGKRNGCTLPCGSRSNCMCCKLVQSNESVDINGTAVLCAPGTCKSKCIIYAVNCTSCEKVYIGRTVQPLHDRLSGHRSNFYKLLNEEVVDDSDDFSLGLHLIHEHKYFDRGDFNKHFRVQFISNCSPALLEKQEHSFIHKLKTLFPVGLNRNNPFGLACIS